jgi:hypothetical protein
VHGATTRTVLSTFRSVYRTEGLGAFYVSYPTTLTMTGASIHTCPCRPKKLMACPHSSLYRRPVLRLRAHQETPQPVQYILSNHARDRRRPGGCRRGRRDESSRRVQDVAADPGDERRFGHPLGSGDGRCGEDHLGARGTQGICKRHEPEMSGAGSVQRIVLVCRIPPPLRRFARGPHPPWMAGSATKASRSSFGKTALHDRLGVC